MHNLTVAFRLAGLSAFITIVDGQLDRSDAPPCATKPRLFVDQSWRVFFDANSPDLSQHAQTSLGGLVNRWKRDGGNLVEVQSHTDADKVKTSRPSLSQH